VIVLQLLQPGQDRRHGVGHPAEMFALGILLSLQDGCLLAVVGQLIGRYKAGH